MTYDLAVRCDKCRFCFPNEKLATQHYGTRRCSEALKMFLEYDAVDADEGDDDIIIHPKSKRLNIKIKKERIDDEIHEVH